MRYLSLLVSFLMPCYVALAQENCPKLLDFDVKTLVEHKTIHLCDAYRGKVLLIVNTASKCGYTYQYEGLEKLYKNYADQGLVVLGFPSNDFAGQEPGDEQQVRDFCRLTYGVKFPMFAKSSVREGIASPLYQALAASAKGYPRWNFHKYLINRQGELVASYGSQMKPSEQILVDHIEKLLKGVE